MTSFAVLFGACLLHLGAAAAQQQNLLAGAIPARIVLVVPERPVAVEAFAIAELEKHLADVAGTRPEVRPAVDGLWEQLDEEANLVVVGRLEDNSLLRQLSQRSFFGPNPAEQGYALRIDSRPGGAGAKTWLAVLCGADPLGVLCAVRDFCHYHCYREGEEAVLRQGRLSYAPTIRVRMLSESGCDVFSADNDHPQFMHDVRLNRFSRNVVFSNRRFIDWLSHWKVTHVILLWCNYPAYDQACDELVRYAHARGIRVFREYVPYRPGHEGPPPEVSSVLPGRDEGDCPRDPNVRQWYTHRLAELITRQPQIDGIGIESPYHDGVRCRCQRCRSDPYPEAELLAEMVQVVRQHRPDMPIIRALNQPVPDAAAARHLAEGLREREGPLDWHVNTVREREHRRQWHDLGPKFSSYMRVNRTSLQGKSVAAEIPALFEEFRIAAARKVFAYTFCHRFYGGQFGSYPVEQDAQMARTYPGRLGPFQLALVAEAAFDPSVDGRARQEKIARIYALTIPDYPATRPATLAELTAAVATPAKASDLPGPVLADPAAHPPQSRLFRVQYSIQEPGYLLAQVCADLDGDGKREMLYSSRGTKLTHMLRAADGSVRWTQRLPGDPQSFSVLDLDGDGTLEILCTVSSPGRLYVLSPHGKILKQWDADDWKLGNSPVVFDADGDGVLDGYLGSRTKYLIRLNMAELQPITRRSPWSQCGCHITAMDVDHDGRWDLFAGCGDDSQLEGTLHRLDPQSLASRWSYAVGDNASSADPVLADIDGDGEVEIVKSVDDYAQDGGADAVYAFKTDGRLLWKVEGLAEEDSPNVADLEGDGQVEIVGMTFGGEVYCLDGRGRFRWRRDLRPQLDDRAHAYMTPILCDLDGDSRLEILAATNGGHPGTGCEANGILFALSATGEILDRLDLGAHRYWGEAFLVNLDDDPAMELVVSGAGGVDVVETKGLGPNEEYFQRRRNYQRLNVVPWAYEDSYFIHRGRKNGVRNLTDNLVLEKSDRGYRPAGTFTTELLVLPPGCQFRRMEYQASQPPGTSFQINLLDAQGRPILQEVPSGARLTIDEPVRLEFRFFSQVGLATPQLDWYRLSFSRR